MIDKKYFNKIQKNLLEYAELRREIIKLSGDALHLAKRAIFAAQKDDIKTSGELIAQVEKIFAGIAKKYQKEVRVFNEGAYKSAQEEYVEAVVFFNFLRNKKIGVITGLAVTPEIYVSGLADVPGELYRYAVRAATARQDKKVKECWQTAGEIIEVFVNMNLTGYNRQKFDQAKTAYAKIEQVVYDLSLRQ